MATKGTAAELPPADPRFFVNPYGDANGWWSAFFRGGWSWRWLSPPQLYFRPGLEYCVGGEFQVIDPMGRVKNYDRVFDGTFSSFDGSLETLYVQTTDSLCYESRTRPNCTWKRTVIRNVAPLYLRMANLPYRFINPERRDNPEKYTEEDWAIVVAMWIPTLVCLVPSVYFLSESAPAGKDASMYLPLPSCHLRYPRIARNKLENRQAVVENLSGDITWATRHTSRIADSELGPYRTLRPRYLYYMEPVDTYDSAGTLVSTRWGSRLKPVPEGDLTPYIFVAFTFDQFPMATSGETLKFLGEKAAIKHFGLDQYAPDPDPAKRPQAAFWISSGCMPSNKYIDKSGIERTLGSEPGDQEQIDHLKNLDVYSISDVVRNSKHTYVLSGNLKEKCSPDQRDTPLKVWGSRVWTLPEIVLSQGDEVTVFHCWMISQGMEEYAFEPVSKLAFAKRAWKDAAHSRQLIEHYSNLQLSRLEFTKVALECLMKRSLKVAFPGDRSYALMGLLRVRPPIDKNDSAFQAFARLSLPQDNDRLMERLICLLPKDREESWDKMSDQYSASLWDVYPETQICAVGDTDTVVIDGAKGAQIQWHGFSPVRAATALSFRRWAITKVVLYGPTLFVAGIILIATGISESIGYAILVITILFLILPMPWYIWKLYQGKLWAVEPCLFGIEGYAPLPRIEEKLFGARMGRMSWSPHGSPLARHKAGEKQRERTFVKKEQSEGDEESRPLIEAGVVDTYPVEPIDPCSECDKCRHMPMASRTCDGHETEFTCWKRSRSEMGELKVFTLVDTYTMTATLFHAVRPPTALIIGGSEGGMKRAIACSFDMTTGIMYRETVLRMPTWCADKMDTLPRIRLGLTRPFLPGDVMVSQRGLLGAGGAAAPMQPTPQNHIPLAPVNYVAPMTMAMPMQPQPTGGSQATWGQPSPAQFAGQQPYQQQQYQQPQQPYQQSGYQVTPPSSSHRTPAAQPYQQPSAQYSYQQTGGSPGQPSTVSPAPSPYQHHQASPAISPQHSGYAQPQQPQQQQQGGQYYGKVQ